jgi:hypothetical protein
MTPALDIKRRRILLDRFQAAHEALFEIESGLAGDIRQRIYTLRVALADIENAEIGKDERARLERNEK